jgi:hypothetical protein
MGVILATCTLLLVMAGCNQTGATSAPTSASNGPVVYFERPPSNTWQAVDWNGKLHGVLPVQRIGTGIGLPMQSPDGSRLLWPTNGEWWFLDRSARRLSVASADPIGPGVAWADDSSGICVLHSTTPKDQSYQVDFISANGGSHTIATFSTSVRPNIAACSRTAGRVVVTTASGYKDYVTQLRKVTFGELLVIDFKSGNVVFRRVFPTADPSTEISSMAVSRDGSLAALGTKSGTSVINLFGGQVVSQAQGVVPAVFSWDGRQLAAAAGLQSELLNSDTGQIAWADSEPNRVMQTAAPNPAGSEVMFLVTYGESDDMLVVGKNGTTRLIARGVFVGPLVACTECSAS